MLDLDYEPEKYFNEMSVRDSQEVNKYDSGEDKS